MVSRQGEGKRLRQHISLRVSRKRSDKQRKQEKILERSERKEEQDNQDGIP
jgi:hypothetical protein